MSASLATVAYIGATILFILSLGGLSSPETARRGNLFGIIGMTLAVVATVLGPRVTPAGYAWIAGALAVGGVIGLYAARTVQMTQMPELVVLVNTSAGLACNGASAPCSPAQSSQIVDLVGYGTANFAEGAAAPAASSATALFRANGGCTDSDQNAADFTSGAPSPRNGSSPASQCGGAPAPVNAPITATCPPLLLQQGAAGSMLLTATDVDSSEYRIGLPA